MKLHNTTITEFIRVFQTHGGHRDEKRLREVLSKLDLAVYEQSTTGNQVLVLTKELLEKTKQGQ